MPSSQLQSHLGRVKRAICRHVPKSISGGLSSNKGVHSNNVDYSRAVDQHAVYMERLCDAVGRGKDGIYVCDADDKHPDCVFVEDAAVVSSPTNAVSTSIGAESRRGEEGDVLDALYDSGITKVLNMRDIEGAYLDGGDVLYTGKHVFVGLSTRTNMPLLNGHFFTNRITIYSMTTACQRTRLQTWRVVYQLVAMMKV